MKRNIPNSNDTKQSRTEGYSLPLPPATDYLPTSVKEMQALGWDSVDVVLFSGDAYVDHPAFGAAVIGRTLQAAGYRVAIVPQPNWQDDLRDFRKFGLRASSSECRPEPWTRWSTTTRPHAAAAATTPTPPADATEPGPTIPRWSIPRP